MYRNPGIPRLTLSAIVASLLSIPTFGVTAMAFSDSTAVPDLTLNGSARVLATPNGRSVILLTPAKQSRAGSAFTTNSIVFNPRYTFRTFFQFQMTDPGAQGAADGMTFVLQTESANALGGDGGSLGYMGITPSVAVEFDTWQNAGDINGNHVAILTDGQLNDIDPQTPYGVTNCQPSAGVFGCMSNGDLWSVWIDYDGRSLNMAIADNSTERPANLISQPIDLLRILGQNSAFAGFTAGTGSALQNHIIVDWFISAPTDSEEQ